MFDRFRRRIAAGRRWRFALAALAGAACAIAAGAAAAAYPERALTIVVPWPAGGATDLATRSFAVHLGRTLGAPIVIENRPGATGVLGSSAAAKAAPDGYTLLLATAETHAINPHIYPDLPYDPAADFSPVAAFAVNPYALVARADFPADTTRDLVERVRAAPGKFTYSSASLGSASQIVMEMFKGAEGLDVLHVPYQGEAPAVSALMGGQVDFIVLPVGRAMAFRESGKVKVYAVTLAERYAGMPDTPTFREAGFPAIEIANWFALMTPAGASPQVLERLHDAVAATASQPQVAADLQRLGLGAFEPMALPAFADFVAAERERWGATIRRAGIRVDR